MALASVCRPNVTGIQDVSNLCHGGQETSVPGGSVPCNLPLAGKKRQTGQKQSAGSTSAAGPFSPSASR